jgi:hypothetical protein
MVVPGKIRNAQRCRAQNNAMIVRNPRNRKFCSIQVGEESLPTSLNRVISRHALPVLKHRPDKDLDIVGTVG